MHTLTRIASLLLTRVDFVGSSIGCVWVCVCALCVYQYTKIDSSTNGNSVTWELFNKTLYFIENCVRLTANKRPSKRASVSERWRARERAITQFTTIEIVLRPNKFKCSCVNLVSCRVCVDHMQYVFCHGCQFQNNNIKRIYLSPKNNSSHILYDCFVCLSIYISVCESDLVFCSGFNCDCACENVYVSIYLSDLMKNAILNIVCVCVWAIDAFSNKLNRMYILLRVCMLIGRYTLYPDGCIYLNWQQKHE